MTGWCHYVTVISSKYPVLCGLCSEKAITNLTVLYYNLLTQGEIQYHDFQPQHRIQYLQNDETSCGNVGYNYPIPMLKKPSKLLQNQPR